MEEMTEYRDGVKVEHQAVTSRGATEWGHLKRKPETSQRRNETIPKRDEPQNPNQQVEGTSRLKGVINTIVGGFARGGPITPGRNT
ncbi:hypothetical protein CR513_17258, partial [Mucuna pruriens]